MYINKRICDSRFCYCTICFPSVLCINDIVCLRLSSDAEGSLKRFGLLSRLFAYFPFPWIPSLGVAERPLVDAHSMQLTSCASCARYNPPLERCAGAPIQSFPSQERFERALSDSRSCSPFTTVP